MTMIQKCINMTYYLARKNLLTWERHGKFHLFRCMVKHVDKSKIPSSQNISLSKGLRHSAIVIFVTHPETFERIYDYVAETVYP